MYPVQFKPIVKDVVFHSASATTQTGEILDVGAYQTLTIEIYGTSSTRTVQFFGRGEGDTNIALLGTKLTDGTTGSSSTGNNELWRFNITGLKKVVMNLSAVSGGNVSVKGRVST